MAREYINNPSKTAEAFVHDPLWTKTFPDGVLSSRRLYKTGDLVRYDHDGSLKFVGRKDNQVKLNGQRLELGEIEHALDRDQNIRHATVVLPK